MSKIALLSARCKATGHPSQCSEPAEGSVTEDNESTSVRVNNTIVANHNDILLFPSHAHDVTPDGACTDFQSHELIPRDTGGISINDKRVMQEGDTQTDPGSGGTATITGTGQPHQVFINGQ